MKIVHQMDRVLRGDHRVEVSVEYQHGTGDLGQVFEANIIETHVVGNQTVPQSIEVLLTVNIYKRGPKCF